MSSRTVNARRRFVAALASVLALTVGDAAMAQDNPTVAAEALFTAGQTLLEQGRYPEACKSFSESQRLDPSVGTLLNLGLCNEKQGKLASAWAAYKEAVALAHTRQDREREDAAQSLVAKVEPRLSRLTIVAKNAAPGLIVRRDGLDVGGLGLALAIDSGEHTIEAIAPGRKTWSATITIGQDGDQKSIEVPPLERAPEDNAIAPGTPPGNPNASAPGVHPKADGTPFKIAGFVLGGAGVVRLAVGTAFGVMASKTTSNAEDDPLLCPGKVCSPAGRAEIDTAQTQATGATVGLAVGGVALAAGVILVVIGFVTEGSSDEPTRAAFYRTPSLSLSPYFTSDASNTGGVVGLAGRFQ